MYVEQKFHSEILIEATKSKCDTVENIAVTVVLLRTVTLLSCVGWFLRH
jgi:hypothetical protein